MLTLADAKYTGLFASPLLAYRWPQADEMNGALRVSIIAEAECNPGDTKTNVGGWHSETGRLGFCGDAGKWLVRRMYEMADEMTRRVLVEYGQPPRQMRWTLHAWANLNPPGAFNRVHTHPGSTWSGTYYVDTGDPTDDEQGTPIHLFDPCQGRANTLLPPLVPSSYLIRPEAGLMILFPSYLPHMVFAHSGNRPRISIAFNLRKEPFP